MKAALFRQRVSALDRPLVSSISLLAAIVSLTLLVSFSPYGRDTTALQEQRLPPSWVHWFGTDDLGRDTLTRTLYAGRISLSIAALSTLTALLLGVGVGAIAGFRGGRTDAFLTSLVDVALAVPVFLLLLFLAAATGGNFWMLSLIIGMSTWMPIARLVRTATLSLRDREFIQAAHVLGMSEARIILHHVLPNVLAPILVSAALASAQAILIESALSFLGFGVQVPTPTWGNMLRASQDYMMTAPWNAIFPGVLIFITVLALHVLGDALHEVLDPQVRSQVAK